MSRIRPFCGRILLDQRLRINDLAVAASGENAAKLLNLTVPKLKGFFMPQRPIQNAAVTEGGYGKIQPRDAAKPHSPISLIPLWLSPVKRPHPRRCSKIGEDDSDPPENWGVMWPR